MKNENELLKHRFWHNLRWVTKTIGQYAQHGIAENQHSAINTVRSVRYCRICRETFLAGASIEDLMEAVCGKPKLEAIKGEVLPIRRPDAGDVQVWPLPKGIQWPEPPPEPPKVS